MDQINRTKTLLRKLLQNHGYHIPIESNVIFVNPEFTLYKAPQNKPIVLPTQLSRFMKKLDQIPSKLNGRHKKLADLLISLHQNESRYAKIPPYTYEQQRKGVSCVSCHSLSVTFNGDKCVCGKCGYVEEVDSAILRSVGELKLLFPEMKITTNVVHEWCAVIESKKIIRRVLKDNLKSHGGGRWLYFE